MPVARWIFRNVLNSVPFGIAVLVAIGLYVAVGSGFVSLREHLEMDELLFFNWWPMKALAVLLIANLTTVTLCRIPLTPPRYGVWTIHLGIILLVLSLSAYYTRKIEGYVPLSKGQTAGQFYDRWERALYVRTQFSTSRGSPLLGLPRFNEYDDSLGNGDYLNRPALRGLNPRLTVIEQATGNRSSVTLGEALGLKDPVKLDIVGYYPYGQIERWKVDPNSTGTGLKIRRADAAEDSQAAWLVANGQAADAVIPVGPAAIEFRKLPTQADIDVATKAAEKLHNVTIQLGATNRSETVEPGDELDVDNYAIRVEGFTPNFPLSANDGTTSDVLTVIVERKNADGTTTKFRRMLLDGRDQQTDFQLDAAGAGPMGKRLPKGTLLDDKLVMSYRLSDPTKLLSSVAETTVKYVLFTADDAKGLTLLRVSSRERSVVDHNADDEVHLHVTAPAEMFAGGDHADHTDVADLLVTRVDHVAPSDAVTSVSKEKRDRNVASSGRGQVVRVRVTCGEWSKIVAVPYDPFAMSNTWPSQRIAIPGASGDFQLMLGNQQRTLPVDVRLEKFEAIPYAGGDASGRSVMRDFRSTVTLMPRENRDGIPDGPIVEATASMNEPAFIKLASPVFFVPGESWLFSQSSWDPNNLDSTVLQVGNRPAVGTMIAACLMIFAGLMYAFYAKPLVIRRMKANALRRAAETRRVAKQPEPKREEHFVESV